MERVFVGIPISMEIQEEVLEWRKRFNLSAPRLHSNFAPPSPRLRRAGKASSDKSGHLPSSNFAKASSDLRRGENGNTLRWIEPKNLHVTLVPPWQEREEGLRVTSDRLRGVEFSSFEFGFNRISFGPDPKEPRMVWAVGEAGQEIKDLRLKIYSALGQRVEERPFRMHVTLARIKNPHPSNFFDAKKVGHLLPKGEGHESLIDWKIKVEKFVLYESRLLPGGADYEVLAEFGLGV